MINCNLVLINYLNSYSVDPNFKYQQIYNSKTATTALTTTMTNQTSIPTHVTSNADAKDMNLFC